MFFLNLSLGEFFALFASLSGIVTALYLLDRAKRKKIVSSLRFWVAAPRVDEQQRRKRIREPWSLLLQLVSLILLLLAVAQLQWGSREHSGRDHVIVLDTSSWMAQRNGNGTLLESVRQKAEEYVDRLPLHDRVMLIRADGIATPVTSFIGSKTQLFRAIEALRPSYSALNLAPALTLASHALKWSTGSAGEVVFIGGTRVANWDDEGAAVPGLRLLETAEQSDDVGIRRLTVTRDAQGDNLWLASVAVRNYDDKPRTLHAALQFGATQFAARTIELRPGEERTAEYKFSTTGPGTLTASIDVQDHLALDDRVQLQLPSASRLRVLVYSNRPTAWQPLLEADSHIQATYLPPSRYASLPSGDVMIVDGFSPATPPRLPSLWIMPGAGQSPVPVTGTLTDVLLSRWITDSPLGEGLRSKEIHLKQAEIFKKADSDVAVAFSERGPLVVARPASGSNPRVAEIGFDPIAGPLKYDVSTPLLFVNILRWLEPESARTTQVTAAGVGSASVVLDPAESKQHFRVVDEHGFAVPFIVRGGILQLYVSKPSIIRIITPETERILSLTIPGIGEFHWKPPSGVPRSLPHGSWLGRSALDLWKFLAAFGALGLVVEWLFFGKQRPLRWRPTPLLREHPSNRDRELVEQR